MRAEQIASAMWPHMDGDYAHKSFTATLHRLRKTLGRDELLVLQDGRLSLNEHCCYLDVWSLDHALDQLDRLVRPDRGGHGDLFGHAGRILDLYTGSFLPDETDYAPVMANRERLRTRILRAVTRLGRHWRSPDELDFATEWLEGLTEADPLAEGLYRHLMQFYERSGLHAEVRDTYERCRTMLATVPGGEPSRETQSIALRINASTRGE